MSYSVGGLIALLIIYTLLIVKYGNIIFKIQLNHFKYNSIEGLRGFLALFVFIHHFIIWYNYIQTGNWDEPQSNLFNHFGKSGVSFFFMITGFLFTNKLLENKEINWNYFFINRTIRLAPLYLFSTFCLILIVLGLSHFKLNEPISDFSYKAFQWLVFTYVGTSDLNLVKDTFTINAGVVWTLAHEWFFYFTLPLFGFIFFRKKVSIVTVFFCITLLTLFIFKGEPLYFHMLYFLMGAFASIVLVFLKNNRSFLQTNLASFLIIFLTAINVYFFHTPENWLCMFLNFIIFTIIAGGNSFFKILELSSTQVLGQLSYGMYILHGIVLFIFNSILVNKAFLQSLSFLEYFYFGFLYITAIILITFLTNKYIEKPFLKLKKAVR